jgi:hypothetical protein
MSDAPENIWPDTLKIRDCKIYDDLGGSGKRIYTTAGNGYERKEYTRSDLAQARIAELEDLLGRYANGVADAEGVFFEPEDAEGEYIIELAKRARAKEKP